LKSVYASMSPRDDLKIHPGAKELCTYMWRRPPCLLFLWITRGAKLRARLFKKQPLVRLASYDLYGGNPFFSNSPSISHPP